jgi:hypothetical protein
MNKRIALVVTLLLMVGVIPAAASKVDFSSMVGQTVTLTVLPYSSGENNSSFYVGLTKGYLNGNPDDWFYMFCNDASDEINVPITYGVTVVGLELGPATNHLGLTLDLLRQQATLGLGFGTAPSGNAALDSQINELIWDYTGGTYAWDSSMTAMNAAMMASYQDRDYSGSFLLDPVSGLQSFMPVDNSAPEVPTMTLIGSSLVAISLLGRKRLQQRLVH